MSETTIESIEVWGMGPWPSLHLSLDGQKASFCGWCWAVLSCRDELCDGRLGMARQCFLELLQRLRSDMDPHKLVIELACGKQVDAPFSEICRLMRP